MIQDQILLASNFVFALNLIPLLRDVIILKKPTNLLTSGSTFATLCVVNVTMASLELWLSALPVCTVMWGLLLYYSWRNKK